ncbi:MULTISPECIES: SDR family oxidoreductase [Nocardiaceae]|uniref:SDR family oxidoreductase n=1 Tax=Rhodococcoides kroppenstedtii TaxID=293050 RepID=A0ABS7NPL1_9NOCA|nr:MULTISPECIES: SDR family oxidoreductase [Rhodococcus]MBY6313639.1 SDR family oxidoreductase [Rhodococcus kroppenstedtii]MBY6319938.1 SDR family oxidoreductase [Rhodococcus kroppenstedtii]MBY6398877.1 SDR family oxidoreductase [Rhodococcus kroppenstedtii]
MTPTIAVTGSTGAVGGAVAALLADSGMAIRLLVRDIGRAPAIPESAVEQCSYDDADASIRTLRGVDVLFMVSGSESATRLDEHRTFVDAAAAAGVRHLVYTSFFGAAPDATFTLARDHFHTEQHIVASGIGHTFLRDNFYADVMEHFAGEDGVIRGPAGDGRVSLVARADVARVAATVLNDPASHVGKAYDLTGPEALTMAEVAATIAEVRGRDVTFHNETLDEAYASRAQWNAPDWQNDAWVSTYTAIASGELSRVSDDVERVTTRRAMTLSEVLRAG